MNKSTNASRLGGFAAGHFGLSLLCYMAVMSSGLFWLTASPGENMAVALVFMVFYFPVGMLMGAVAPWARVSTPQELGRSVVRQVGIAWLWGWLVLMAAFVPWMLGALLCLVFPTFVLAAPSSYFVLCALGLADVELWDPDSFLVWLGAMLLAGLLPPLLYNLGNFCVSRGMAARAHNVRPYADLQASPEGDLGKDWNVTAQQRADTEVRPYRMKRERFAQGRDVAETQKTDG